MTNEKPTTGEFASIDQVAATPNTTDSALPIAQMISDLLSDETECPASELKVVALPTVLRPGGALMFTLMNVDGVEFEVYVRQAL